jgi:hypothetical protein
VTLPEKVDIITVDTSWTRIMKPEISERICVRTQPLKRKPPSKKSASNNAKTAKRSTSSYCLKPVDWIHMQHKVREVTLKNGLKGLLIDVPQATVMSYDFNLRAGYYLAEAGKWEVPHVMEHLLCGANSEFRKARLFEAEVKKNGAYTNAYTNTYNVGYVGECADFEWDRILNLLMLSISQPHFLQEEFQAEVGNVKEELTGYLSNYFRQLGIALSERVGFLVKGDRARYI